MLGITTRGSETVQLQKMRKDLVDHQENMSVQ